MNATNSAGIPLPRMGKIVPRAIGRDPWLIFATAGENHPG